MKNLIKISAAALIAFLTSITAQAQNETTGKETKQNSSTTNKTSPVNKNTSAKKDNAGHSASNNTGNSSITNPHTGANTNTTTGAGHSNIGNGEDYKNGNTTAEGKEYREPIVGNNKTGRTEKKTVSTDTSAGPAKSASVKKNSQFNK